MRHHGRLALLAAALLLAAASAAHAHGGGRSYTATGPMSVIPASGATFYGGFGVPPITGSPYIVQPLSYQAPAYATTPAHLHVQPYGHAQAQAQAQPVRWVRVCR
jgi:hypothetical protein